MEVFTPASLSEALQQLQLESEVSVLAGGTDLLVKLKDKKINPARAMNIANLKELKSLRVEKEQLIIGALATHQEIAESAEVRQYAPILAEACSKVGALQIRNLGTIGGNLGTASPAGDTIPPLVVHNASLVLKSASSEREVPVREFITGPGRTVLNPGELITAIIIPFMQEGEIGFFKKLGQRQALAISIVNIAAKAKLKDGVIEYINISCGSVGPTVIELSKTAANLAGCSLTSGEIWPRVKEAGLETTPISDIRASLEYRQQMVGVLLYEGLCELINRQPA